MTMPSSGIITFDNINTELRFNSGSTCAIGSTCPRTVAGVASGQISMSNFYGKYLRGNFIGTTPGVSSQWTVPACVYKICVACVGGGANGGYADATNGGRGGGGGGGIKFGINVDRKSTRLNSSHVALSRMPSSA